MVEISFYSPDHALISDVAFYFTLLLLFTSDYPPVYYCLNFELKG